MTAISRGLPDLRDIINLLHFHLQKNRAARFSAHVKFNQNPLHTNKDMGPLSCQSLQRNGCTARRGNACPPGIDFLISLG